MTMYDWDGTTTRELGKVYDWDGTTSHQLGKGYDWDGTTNNLIYSAELVLLNGTENQNAWTLEAGSKTDEGLSVHYQSNSGTLNKAWKCSTTWSAGEFSSMVVNAFYVYGAAESYFKVRFYNSSDTLIQTIELWSSSAGVSDIQSQAFQRTVNVPSTAVKCDFVFYCGQYYSGSGYKLYSAILQ